VNQSSPIFNPNPDGNAKVQRQDWYSPVALASDRVRPRYPQQLLAKLASLPDQLNLDLSPYIQLPSKQREDLLVGLRDRLTNNCPNGIPLTHLAAIQMASKV
jgi:hypothetical protein